MLAALPNFDDYVLGEDQPFLLGGDTEAPGGVSTGLVGWWKADAITGLADGDAVSTWADSSGNGLDATQTGTARPTYKTGILNSLPVVRFDGTDDLLSTVGFSHGPTFTVFAVVKAAAVPATAIFVGDANIHFQLRYESGGSTASLTMWPDTNADTMAVTATNANVLSAVRQSTSGEVFVNGNSDGSTASSADTASGLRGLNFGAWDPGVAHLQGDIAEIAFYDTALSPTDRQAVENYLISKYALGTSPATLTPGAVGGTSGATATITTSALVVPGTAAGTSNSTATVTVPANLVPGSTAGLSGASASVTVPAKVVPGATSGTSAATASVTTIAKIIPGTTAGTSGASATVTAIARIVPGGTGGTSNATGSVTTPARVVPGAVAGTSTATGTVTTIAVLQPGGVGGTSSATGSVTTIARIVPGVTGGTSDATAVVTAIGGAVLTPGVVGGTSSASALVTTIAKIIPGTVAGGSGATASVTAPLYVIPDAYGHAVTTITAKGQAVTKIRRAAHADAAVTLAGEAAGKVLVPA